VCFSHFPWFSVFSLYSRSYSVHFYFSTFLSVSRHKFKSDSVNLSISLFFQCSLPQFISYSACFSFCMNFSFLTIFHVW
jgi:hypothetical protein